MNLNFEVTVLVGVAACCFALNPNTRSVREKHLEIRSPVFVDRRYRTRWLVVGEKAAKVVFGDAASDSDGKPKVPFDDAQDRRGVHAKEGLKLVGLRVRYDVSFSEGLSEIG